MQGRGRPGSALSRSAQDRRPQHGARGGAGAVTMSISGHSTVPDRCSIGTTSRALTIRASRCSASRSTWPRSQRKGTSRASDELAEHCTRRCPQATKGHETSSQPFDFPERETGFEPVATYGSTREFHPQNAPERWGTPRKRHRWRFHRPTTSLTFLSWNRAPGNAGQRSPRARVLVSSNHPISTHLWSDGNRAKRD